MTATKTILAILLAMVATTGMSQDEGFIYGTVTTIDDQEYKGAIRWGKEEVYWSDMFNASKDENENLKFLTKEELDYLESRDDSWASSQFNFSWNNWDYDNNFVHQLSVPFGTIKRIEPFARDKAAVTFQNGETYEVDGSGYNDIGTKVKVYDQDLGIIEINWSRIESISFEKTPRKLTDRFGAPLYGKVWSDAGEFEGLIQWDHDERVGSDKLDGDTDDGDVSISFDKIASVERLGYSRSIVTLKSGRELELSGSNDVNSENRGIIVTVEGMGRIDIPWKEFDRVEFSQKSQTGPAYASYKEQNQLRGTVRVNNGDVHTGLIIYDLDERYDFEVLDGEDDDVSFEIDFKNIAEITPKNYNYSKIKLTSGQEFVLGDGQDVSDENDGIIILADGQPVYIPWEKVTTIQLK